MNKITLFEIQEVSNGYIVSVGDTHSVHHTIADVMHAVQDVLATSTPIPEGVKPALKLEVGKAYYDRIGKITGVFQVNEITGNFTASDSCGREWVYSPSGKWLQYDVTLNSSRDLVEEVK